MDIINIVVALLIYDLVKSKVKFDISFSGISWGSSKNKSSSPRKHRKKEDNMPSLDDIENDNNDTFDIADIEKKPVKSRKDFKVETSYGDSTIGDV